jgi:hypothetical protein
MALSNPNKVSTCSLEQDAEWLEEAMSDVRRTLAEMLPIIRRVHDAFTKNHKRGSIVLGGCRSWGEYCRTRLRVTPEAVLMMEKRMRLKEAAADAAKEAAALKREFERWSAELGRGTEFARARNMRWLDEQMQDVAGGEPTPEDDALDLGDADRVVPIETLLRTIASLDEATAMLNRIIVSGTLTIPALLAAARKCAAHTDSVAVSVRQELHIHDPDTPAKIINIETSAEWMEDAT